MSALTSAESRQSRITHPRSPIAVRRLPLAAPTRLIVRSPQGFVRRSIKQIAPNPAAATNEPTPKGENQPSLNQLPHTKRPAQSNFTHENLLIECANPLPNTPEAHI